MKSGVCVKCSTEEVYRVRSQRYRFLALGLFTTARLVDYVCGSCGFVESVVEDERDRAKVRKCATRVHRW